MQMTADAVALVLPASTKDTMYIYQEAAVVVAVGGIAIIEDHHQRK